MVEPSKKRLLDAALVECNRDPVGTSIPEAEMGRRSRRRGHDFHHFFDVQSRRRDHLDVRGGERRV